MHASAQPLPGSAVTLLTGVVDYAGLFPPAALGMRDALAEYERARRGPDAWMLGRFVVPAARIAELLEHIGSPATPIHLSVIASEADLGSLSQWTNAHIALDAVECKPLDREGIDRVADATSGISEVYVEVDANADFDAWFARLAARGLRAKIRTGGTVATAFPSPARIVDFMAAALRAGVRFKATAGLHHAIRGPYRLTYEANAATAVMHGYLNVLLAAATLGAGQPRDAAERILSETDSASLAFGPDSIRWSGREWPVDSLRATRIDGLLGFGSCSISEPAGEIRALALTHSERQA